MQTSQTLSCPKCGQTPEKVSTRRADLHGELLDLQDGAPKETIYVFQCKCGASFMHRMRQAELSRQVMG